ncbi:MAG TPA: sensory rhodopsin transducer [Candidatus Eisenbacteria bacterium]|nr:sensory rhodopsin transducer [Candidatus Eisenbacteria bacterium]
MDEKKYGLKNWFFPDAELPPLGEGAMQGHESIIILNPNKNLATVEIKCYFEYPKKSFIFTAEVEADSVRCLRTNEPEDMGGNEIPLETQYAISLHSDQPIVAQYGRLDNRQTNLAFYTTPGYAE